MQLTSRFTVMLLATMAIGAAPVAGQQLSQEALKSFPAGTTQIEYARPAALRKLANYNTLRQQYMGPWLKKLVASLGQLGIKESDVDELMLGWSSGDASKATYGLAAGRFDPAALDKSAAERNIAPDTIGGKTGYCLGAGLETPCIVLLEPNLGAFGTLNSLSEMMDVRSGARPSLGSDATFLKISNEAETTAPVWGIATDGAVAGWFQNWMPTQRNVRLDWAQVFQNVDALSYAVNTGDNVQLHMELYCKSSDAAASLHQVLEGLKLAQELAWQTQYPNQTNPFSGMEVTLQGSEISLRLAASFSDLTAAGSAGSASQ
jgi:hypothetical protein